MTQHKASRLFSIYCSASLLAVSFLVAACSIPNLEEPECDQARDAVREFYSFHFANSMEPIPENVKARERFLTGEYATSLLLDANTLPATKVDYFTLAEDFPKAFRAGACKVLEPGRRVRFEVLMFWKDDYRSEQRSVFTTMEKVNDSWRIDAVSPEDK